MTEIADIKKQFGRKPDELTIFRRHTCSDPMTGHRPRFTSAMMRKSFISRDIPAVLLICGALVSCATKGDLDPWAAPTDRAQPEFLNVEMGGIQPGYLRAKKTPYKIGSGDVLDVELVEVEGTRAASLVMPDGMVYYDLAGAVPASGLTPEQLEEELAKRLERSYSAPFVSVRIAEYGSQTYTMLGQFAAPGSYPLGVPTTLLQAISLAGGLSGFTQEVVDLDRSIVLRGTEVIPVDFDGLIRKGDMTQNIYLEPGDYVFLAEASGATVYVLGDVARASVLPYTQRTTFLSALAQAGGPNPSAHAGGIVLIRGSLRSPQVAGLNFKDIARGRERDFKLQPGDIIWVPRAPWQKLEDYAKTFVRSSATAIVLRLIDRDRVERRTTPVIVSP